jgi:hypothetical protein
MDNAEAEKRAAQDHAEAVELAAETLGVQVLEALVFELEQVPEWARRSESDHALAVDRLRDKVLGLVGRALGVLFTGQYPVCQAELARVAFGEEITATLKIDRGATSRHELADATGSRVLVVIADPGRFTAGIDAVRARAAQGDLFREGPATPVDGEPNDDLPAYAASSAPDMGELIGTLVEAGVPLRPGEAEAWTVAQQRYGLNWARKFIEERDRGEDVTDFPRPWFISAPIPRAVQ